MKPVSMTDHIDAFLEFLSVQKNYSENTLRAYHNDLYDFIWFFAVLKHIDPEKPAAMESLMPDDVDGLSIRAYLGHLYKKKNKKSSVARKLSSIRSFYTYLMKQGVVTNNPGTLVSTPKQDKPIPVYLTVDDMFASADRQKSRRSAVSRKDRRHGACYSTLWQTDCFT